MKTFLTIAVIALSCTTFNDNKSQPIAISSEPGIRVLRKNFNYPWEITFSKDGYIWMSEREGKISKIDPVTGNTNFSFTINEVESINEGGLLGMALHPDFVKNGLLYVVYNYNKAGKHLEKLVQFRSINNGLTHPVVLLDGITDAIIELNKRLVA